MVTWFDEELGDGKNATVIYPNLQTFREIYKKYVKHQSAKKEGGNVKGLSCYHVGNYNPLTANQKKDIARKGKKLFEAKETRIRS